MWGVHDRGISEVGLNVMYIGTLGARAQALGSETKRMLLTGMRAGDYQGSWCIKEH